MQNEFKLEENLIILSAPTIQAILKEKNPADILALYAFYYYTAKWQKTNQAYASISFTKKALHLGEDRISKATKALIRLKLIERIEDRDENGRIARYYIKINYIWCKDTLDRYPQKPVGEDIPLPEIDGTGNQEGNALSVNNIIYSKVKTLPSKEKDTIHKDIGELFSYYKKQFLDKVSNTPPVFNWGACEKLARPLMKDLGLEHMKHLVDVYMRTRDQFYVDNAYSLSCFLSTKIIHKLNQKK